MMNSWLRGFAAFGLKERFKSFWHDNGVLRNLLAINMGVSLLFFLLFLVSRPVNFLMQSSFSIRADIFPWLACPSDLQVLLRRPWTLITSLFVHDGFWHLFFNMLMLYIVGNLFVRQFSSRKLLSTYLIGGIVGNIIYIVCYQIFPVFESHIVYSSCVGASGAILAILFTLLIYQPNHRMQIWPFVFSQGIAMKWIALIFVLIDLIGISDGVNAGGHLAHLGGAMYGSLYALCLRNDLDSLFSRRPRKPKVNKKFYTSADRPFTDYEFNEKKHQDEQRLNDILGKVSKEGYGALSPEERDFLYHYKR